jgi:hypothetical protein
VVRNQVLYRLSCRRSLAAPDSTLVAAATPVAAAATSVTAAAAAVATTVVDAASHLVEDGSSTTHLGLLLCFTTPNINLKHKSKRRGDLRQINICRPVPLLVNL